jgi:hypothetical protein
MPSTIRDLTELTAVAADDYFLVSDTSDVTNRDKRISRTNLLASAVFVSGTPTAGRVASWLNATTVQDGGFAVSDIARLSVANTFTASILTTSIGTNRNAVNNDSVLAIPGGSGLFLLSVSSNAQTSGVISFRAASGPYCVGLVLGTNVVVTTGVLTGTTGTTGKMTVSAATDGNIYVENRLGSTQTLRCLVIS